VFAHEPVELRAPCTPYGCGGVSRTERILEEGLSDEVRSSRRLAHGVTLIDLADRGKNHRSGNREPERGYDGKSQDEPGLAL